MQHQNLWTCWFQVHTKWEDGEVLEIWDKREFPYIRVMAFQYPSSHPTYKANVSLILYLWVLHTGC